MNKRMISNIALFLTALIWGLSFVAQKAGMDYLGPFGFNCSRSLLGGLSLIPVIFLIKLMKEDKRTKETKHKQHITLIKAGLSCGLALFIAISIQQYSMIYATAGKAGFISALYIIYVPVITMFFGKKLNKNVKISIGLAIIGLNFYDILLLISAFFYGVHILVVNYFSHKVNATKMSCIQFFVVGILSIPLMLIFENPTLQNFIDCKVPILYAGILTCGVAYTLQIFGQKYTNATIASLILSLESVFAVIGGNIILHETMTPKEVLGCLFMILGVILSQIKNKKIVRKIPTQNN